MVIAFLIWSAISVVFLIIGIKARRSETAVSFWSNAKAPEVSDIKQYNLAVSNLWFVFALVFEASGIPLLFCTQNSPLALISILGPVALIIGAMIAYTRIEAKYRKHN